MSRYVFRGFEMCNNHMWKWKTVERALDFMEMFHMNALIFHQYDLMDQVVLPEQYFTEEEMWAYWPIRYCAVGTNGAYIRKVIREARERGIDFYFEVKEIWYPEALVDKYPELIEENGHVCPSNSFWFEFLENKTRELLRHFPDMAGLIVSPATRESKVSVSANRCGCQRCRNTSEEEWYRGYIQAVYKPLKECKKRLVVRDFAYTAGTQSSVLRASVQCGSDIVMGLKNVPHDFWPTFPDNPAISHYENVEKWIEYDAWGQYCGAGIFPCGLVRDMMKRFCHCGMHGCSGMWVRTDWELLDESCCQNTFSMLNLIAAAMLSWDTDCTEEEIYQAWVDYGLMSPLQEESKQLTPVRPTAPDAAGRLKQFMDACCEVIEKALYVRGHVFNYSSRFQHACQSIYNVMNVYHQRIQWDPPCAELIRPTKENLEHIMIEKSAAVEEAMRLGSILDIEHLGVPEEFAEDIKKILDLFVWYVKGFQRMAGVYFHMQKALEDRMPPDFAQVEEENRKLKQYTENLKKRLDHTSYPFYVYWVMDTKELDLLAADVDRMLQMSFIPEA
ncbi:hypothetical protein [Lachnotalea sp. AF33-28]|uniref:hypothetical protein n=1 Tax=Lachnotalea sp. AF33-28 TaxID=2292046 RepID=UPI000E543C56|nr:hypothetical protein [Lachnotalea sp. AF33-28]RHP36216.1 hypothetical protein DWZ56_00735 [Lachnotalea sp. AF33-28]